MKESLLQVLTIKADQISKASASLSDKTRDWQTIKKFLTNRFEDFKLTKTQEEKLKRYQFIYGQLTSGNYTETDIVFQLKKNYDIEYVQAYEDINATKEIYSSFININKRFELKIELDIARDMRRKCLAINDMKNAGIIGKNIVAILGLLENQEETPGDLFEGIQIEATFDPRLLGAADVNMKEILTAINAKRNAKIKVDLFEDLPFEPIADENEENSL